MRAWRGHIPFQLMAGPLHPCNVVRVEAVALGAVLSNTTEYHQMRVTKVRGSMTPDPRGRPLLPLVDGAGQLEGLASPVYSAGVQRPQLVEHPPVALPAAKVEKRAYARQGVLVPCRRLVEHE